MKKDTRKRAKRAVLISVIEQDDGSIRLHMDDVKRADPDGKAWNFDVVYTWKDYDKKIFTELSFDNKELADMAYSMIARLYAYYERKEL